MYNIIKARVRVGGDLTECFMCPCGLKQGEICSPILFSLINELVDEVINNNNNGNLYIVPSGSQSALQKYNGKQQHSRTHVGLH